MSSYVAYQTLTLRGRTAVNVAESGPQRSVRAPTGISKNPAATLRSVGRDGKPALEKPPPQESARRIGARYGCPRRNERLCPGFQGHHDISNRTGDLRNDHAEHRDGGQPHTCQRGRPQLRLRRDRPEPLRAGGADRRRRHSTRHAGHHTAFRPALAGAGDAVERPGQADASPGQPAAPEPYVSSKLTAVGPV